MYVKYTLVPTAFMSSVNQQSRKQSCAGDEYNRDLELNNSANHVSIRMAVTVCVLAL